MPTFCAAIRLPFEKYISVKTRHTGYSCHAPILLSLYLFVVELAAHMGWIDRQADR